MIPPRAVNLSLAATAEEFREFALAAIDLVAQYYRDLSSMPVMPATTAAAVRQLLDEPLPEAPGIPSEILRAVQDVVYPLCRHNGSVRQLEARSARGRTADAS